MCASSRFAQDLMLYSVSPRASFHSDTCDVFPPDDASPSECEEARHMHHGLPARARAVCTGWCESCGREA